MPVVTALLALLVQLAPSLGSPALASIITTLQQILPTIVAEVADVAPYVKNVIAALRSNSEITPEQWAQLDALEAQIDQAFEAAATAAEADDATAKE